MNFILF